MVTPTRRSATAGLIGLAATGWTARARAAEPLRMGFAVSQSGKSRGFRRVVQTRRRPLEGEHQREGRLLGRPVEIVVYDDRSDPATAARLYERLITGDKVELLLSPWGSASCATASAVAEKHKRVFLNAGGASESIHLRGFKYVFQSAPAIGAYVSGVAPMATRHGFKTIAVVSRDTRPLAT